MLSQDAAMPETKDGPTKSKTETLCGFGRLLREARAIRGHSIEEAAEAMKVGRQKIIDWETGHDGPRQAAHKATVSCYLFLAHGGMLVDLIKGNVGGPQ